MLFPDTSRACPDKRARGKTCVTIKYVSPVDPWDMLNYFCFHVYAQMLLFTGENGNVF